MRDESTDTVTDFRHEISTKHKSRKHILDVMSKPSFSISDLQSGAKRLSNVDPPSSKRSSSSASESKESREMTEDAFEQLGELEQPSIATPVDPSIIF